MLFNILSGAAVLSAEEELSVPRVFFCRLFSARQFEFLQKATMNWIFRAKDEIARGIVNAEEFSMKTKSLDMMKDPRYKEIDHFTKVAPSLFGEDSGAKDPLAKNSLATGTSTTSQLLSLDQDLESPARGSLAGVSPHSPGGALAKALENKGKMQRNFETSVKRLMVDFSLSDDPYCRTNHLDRMHSWFKNHGKKQVKKAKDSPGYLTFDELRPSSDVFRPGAEDPHDHYPPGSTFGFLGRRRPATSTVIHQSLGVTVSRSRGSSRPTTSDGSQTRPTTAPTTAWGPR